MADIAEIRRLVQERSILEDASNELYHKINRIVNQAWMDQDPTVTQIWAYDVEGHWSGANALVLFSNDLEFIKNVSYKVDEVGDEFLTRFYYDDDGIELTAPKDLFVGMLDVVDEDGKMFAMMRAKSGKKHVHLFEWKGKK